jgi:hypothetical protein
VGRSYAGVLGPLAFAILAARGLLSGAGAEGTMLAASAGLVIFSAIGYIAGRLAEVIVQDAVQARVAAEIAAHEAEANRVSNQNQTAAKRAAA